MEQSDHHFSINFLVIQSTQGQLQLPSMSIECLWRSGHVSITLSLCQYCRRACRWCGLSLYSRSQLTIAYSSIASLASAAPSVVYWYASCFSIKQDESLPAKESKGQTATWRWIQHRPAHLSLLKHVCHRWIQCDQMRRPALGVRLS